MKSDTFTQEQLQHFAEQVRRAVAGDMAVVISCGESDKIEGHQQTQCAIAGKVSSGNERQEQTKAMVTLIRVADQMLRCSTGDKMHLVIEGPDGQQALGKSILDRFEFTCGPVKS